MSRPMSGLISFSKGSFQKPTVVFGAMGVNSHLLSKNLNIRKGSIRIFCTYPSFEWIDADKFDVRNCKVFSCAVCSLWYSQIVFMKKINEHNWDDTNKKIFFNIVYVFLNMIIVCISIHYFCYKTIPGLTQTPSALYQPSAFCPVEGSKT